nr:MAG TPA: hypothetical protein [Caudoviricetes sp.]
MKSFLDCSDSIQYNYTKEYFKCILKLFCRFCLYSVYSKCRNKIYKDMGLCQK